MQPERWRQIEQLYHSVRELGFACELPIGVPANANVTSVRNAPALYDDGAIDAIGDADILAGAIAYPDGVHGRPNAIVSSEGAMRSKSGSSNCAPKSKNWASTSRPTMPASPLF